MAALTANILRLICNADRPDRVIDQRTLQAPAILRGFDYKVQLGVFIDGALLDSIANWQSVTLELRALTNGAVDHTSEPLTTKTVSSGFDVPTSGEWTGKTNQHAEIDLSLDDTSIDAADCWLSIYVTTTDSPAKEYFLAYGNVKVIDSGAGNNGEPQDNADNHYTKAESDARFMPLAPIAIEISDPAWRVKWSEAGGFLQLKDSDDGMWHAIFLDNGALQVGPADGDLSAGEEPADTSLATFRIVSAAGGVFLQLRDATLGTWHPVWLDGGALQVGEAA